MQISSDVIDKSCDFYNKKVLSFVLESPCCSATCHEVGGETRVAVQKMTMQKCAALPPLSPPWGAEGRRRRLAVMRYLLGGGSTVSAGGGHDAGGFDELWPALLSMGPILKMDSNMMMMMMKLLKLKRYYWLLASDSNQSEPQQDEISPISSVMFGPRRTVTRTTQSLCSTVGAFLQATVVLGVVENAGARRHLLDKQVNSRYLHNPAWHCFFVEL